MVKIAELRTRMDIPGAGDISVQLSFIERMILIEALKIAESAVRHREMLESCVTGKNNILTDPGETANEIYIGAGMYKFLRDGKVST